MSQKERVELQTASLLLHPSNTGISWTQATRNAILIPVSQMEAQNNQSTSKSGTEESGKTGRISEQQFGAFDTQEEVSPVSQLQKPLRLTSQKPVHPSISELSEPPTSKQRFDCTIPSSQLVSGQSAPPQYSSAPFPGTSEILRPPPPLSQGVPSDYGQAPLNYPSSVDLGTSVASSPFSTNISGVSVMQPSSSVPTIMTSNTQHAGAAFIPSDNRSIDASYPHAYTVQYHPVQAHWFYKKIIEKKDIWVPFSKLDSQNLEQAYVQGSHDAVVSTDGGRYDVYLNERKRKPIYWDENPCDVQRCTWFYKPEGQQRFYPYDEEMASKIEEHYRVALTTNRWHQRLDIGSDSIVVHNPNVIVHFQPSSQPDEWGNVHEGQLRPRVVKRGVEDFEHVEDGEPVQIDHLIFVVHGVGAICDLRFRTIVECVDDIRSLALNMQQTHFKQHVENRSIGRVEFLPVSWHGPLHSGTTGIDSRINPITLSSIPKLRHFINDTLLDILFYTSPIYCQTIVDTVGSEINRLYDIFVSKNPNFSGRVSLAGHSLGSLILFDILGHQLSPNQAVLSNPDEKESNSSNNLTSNTGDVETQVVTNSVEDLFQKLNIEEYVEKVLEEKIDMEVLLSCQENDLKELGIPMGPRKKLLAYFKEQSTKPPAHETPKELQQQTRNMSEMKSNSDDQCFLGSAGTGQPCVTYPRLNFSPCCFFALGSPIAMFLTIRGIKTLGEDFRLPTCPSFFNIFHPFDPVAYRIETLIDPTFSVKPVLIPHHKGRKRMHLELKESLSRVGSDLKQKLIDSIRYTWNSLNEFARAHRFSAAQVEEEVDRVVEEELKKHEETDESESPVSEEAIRIGQLNGGRRIDYSLQEKPIESFNEYLFALGSHACYWESEDTVLMILKEVYAVQGVHPTKNAIQLYNPTALRSQSLPAFVPLQEQMSFPLQQDQFSQLPTQVTAHERVSQLPLPPPPPPQPQQTVPPSGSSQPLAPPPLTGFVKVSPIQRR